MAYQWISQADDQLQPGAPAPPQNPYTNPDSQFYNPYLNDGSTGNPYTDPNSPETQQYQQQQGQAQTDADAYAAAQAAWMAQADANTVANGGGYTLGARQDPDLYNRSALRMDQSIKERTAEQRGNYFYGGYEGGAQDAVDAARGAVSPYASALGTYGDAFNQNAGLANRDYGTGITGVYGTADALTQYAQQGPGASVAQAQLDANTGTAMRQQLALAGSGRGAGGGASAFRQAAGNQAQIQGQANAQAATLQAQEAQDWRQAQLAAYGQAGQLYGAGAGTSAGYAQGMGGLATDAQQGGGQLAMGGEQLANQIQGTALSGAEAYEQNLTNIYGIDKGIPAQPSQDMTTKDWIGLGIQGVGTAASFISDIRAKKNIEPASALDAIGNAGSYSYDYRNPERHGEGRYVGPMAQELESAPGVVSEGPGGTKQVDPGRLTMLNTSAIAELNNKVDAATQNASYSGDPQRLAFEQQKYGTPVYGAPAPEAEAASGGSGLLDFVFGPSVGQQAADITEEEYRNNELRRLFRQPAREDTAL